MVPDWDVAYSSNPTAPGGYYRSMLGRAVLQTREMVQSINAPDAIINKVAFAAFGILDGKVTLQGTSPSLLPSTMQLTWAPSCLLACLFVCLIVRVYVLSIQAVEAFVLHEAASLSIIKSKDLLDTVRITPILECPPYDVVRNHCNNC